ncbi:Gfo/Idh/MocA family protein [Halobaculum lipolyticum]|uniref:Gfo/Idh/MocA family protein n=1 Tax=Halobaculum lipolyticum TaxID=3032001 RepID=A0ABD5W5P9_9EURY|nr:Gfo/Idh/MocA family oxidoreductase [Halobaculum sp. DT31]
MTEYAVVVIGAGPDPANPTVDGFAMGYRHAEAFENDPRCSVVGVADVVPEHAAAFAEAFDLPDDAVYEEYERLLADLEPDIATVAVPPAVHHEVVVGCARGGHVDAVHCEKPMATNWSDAQSMVQECWRADVQLTFNRQRRFAKPFTAAKRLLDDGAVGDLRRVEITWGDFYDTGAHTVDLAGMFVDERRAEWVLAALDYREEDVRFGTHQENQMWAQWRYDDGVYGVLSGGAGDDFADAAFVVRGDRGEIRVDVDDGPMLEVVRGDERETVDVDGETMHRAGDETDRYGSRFQDRAAAAVVDGLAEGHDPVLSGRIGLNTAEILFAGYESVRRNARVDLPAEVAGHPLEEMVESGRLTPSPAEE